MYQDAYNTIQEILKDSVIRSIEFYVDGSFMCQTSVPNKNKGMVAFKNMDELLKFIDENPF